MAVEGGGGRRGLWREAGKGELKEFDDGYACSAEADVFLVEVGDGGHGGKVLADECLEDACACSMEDFHSGRSRYAGVVDEVCEGLDGLIASHASHVELFAEIEGGGAYVFLGLETDEGGCHVAFAFGWLGGCESLCLDVGGDVAEDYHGFVAAYLLYLTNGVLSFEPDVGAYGEWGGRSVGRRG